MVRSPRQLSFNGSCLFPGEQLGNRNRNEVNKASAHALKFRLALSLG